MEENRHLLLITDELAMIRTKLANERTFLAYLRTFVGAFAAGVGLIKLTGDLFFVCAGFVLVAIAPVILLIGIIRVIRVKREIGAAFVSALKTHREDQKGA